MELLVCALNGQNNMSKNQRKFVQMIDAMFTGQKLTGYRSHINVYESRIFLILC